MIQYVVIWLHNIPKEDQDKSPREMIIRNQVLDTKMVCKMSFEGNLRCTITMIQLIQ